jgi:hypothetical protein
MNIVPYLINKKNQGFGVYQKNFCGLLQLIVEQCHGNKAL